MIKKYDGNVRPSGGVNVNKGNKQSILISDYIEIIKDAGWRISQFLNCPLSSQRMHPSNVCHMQNKRTFGVIRRYLIIAWKR